MDLSLCLLIVPNTLLCSIGPRDLTYNSLSPDSKTLVLTVTDNLYKQGMIKENVVAVSFEPTTGTTSASVTNGELIFGGVDSSKFIGNITTL